ncbi:unnamed protein product [Closterium sp. NIES-54]
MRGGRDLTGCQRGLPGTLHRCLRQLRRLRHLRSLRHRHRLLRLHCCCRHLHPRHHALLHPNPHHCHHHYLHRPLLSHQCPCPPCSCRRGQTQLRPTQIH